MIKEARGFGATIDEAKENAITNLNAGAEDDIQFEVISTPKKKMFGLFGGCQAEVRVYVEMPDEKPKKVNKPQQKNDKKPPVNNANKQKAPEKKPAENKPAEKKNPEKPAAKAQDVKQDKAMTVENDYKDAVDSSLIAADSQAGKAVAYLKTILAELGCENITVKVAEKENGAFIILDGEGLGVVIGHRGETLDALQYLAGLAANSGGGYYKVSLNIGNYREKREQTLTTLATRVAEQVLETGRSRSLEPMNPYERRIIHTAIQNIDGVVSNSFGEGSGRRVVIAVEGGDITPPKRDFNNRGRGGRDNRNRSGGNRDRGRDRDRKPSSTVATTPSREPKKDTDVPLYGKINKN